MKEIVKGIITIVPLTEEEMKKSSNCRFKTVFLNSATNRKVELSRSTNPDTFYGVGEVTLCKQYTCSGVCYTKSEENAK